MNRQVFKKSFTQDKLPEWGCPACDKGVLKLKPNSFVDIEGAASRAFRRTDDWEPEFTDLRFSCMMICSDGNCGEGVSLSGDGCLDLIVEYDKLGFPAEHSLVSAFRPKYFWPPLNIIEIPNKTPRTISNELTQSFELFFSNPPSSANHVRIALEHILTELKVKRFARRNGRQLFLNLHQRIKLLPHKHSHLGDLCLAIKWLGNAGSHSESTITLDDVMDAYEIFAVLLQELYDDRKKTAKKLAKSINKRKGPKRGKRG